MLIRAGFEIAYDCPQPTPMVLMLSVHPSRAADLRAPGYITFDPFVPSSAYQTRPRTDRMTDASWVASPDGRRGMKVRARPSATATWTRSPTR